MIANCGFSSPATLNFTYSWARSFSTKTNSFTWRSSLFQPSILYCVLILGHQPRLLILSSLFYSGSLLPPPSPCHEAFGRHLLPSHNTPLVLEFQSCNKVLFFLPHSPLGLSRKLFHLVSQSLHTVRAREKMLASLSWPKACSLLFHKTRAFLMYVSVVWWLRT